MLPFTLYELNENYLHGTSRDTDSFHQAESRSSSGNFLPATDSNNSMVYGPFFDKHVALRVIVGITCCLSMCGAALIILSYFLIKDIQTKSRHILVHLSLADFGVACCNFIGVTVYFDQYLRYCPAEQLQKTGAVVNHSNSALQHSVLSCNTLQGMCKAQAFLAAFSTLASVLWTLSLAVYIYCLVVHSKNKVHYKVVYVSYVLCWGLPLFISLWLISTDRLGYSPHGGSGWCTLKLDTYSGKQDTFAVVFGNDLWIYLTFIMVTLLYFTTHCYIKFQLKDFSPVFLQGNNLAAVSKADTKFILIPFFFLLLRMWTMILVILLVYAGVHPPHLFSLILLYAAGIGDSGQGFVNAFLFCVFTPKVRQHLLNHLTSLWSYLKNRCPAFPISCRRGRTWSQNSLSSTFPVMRSKLSNCGITGSFTTDSSEDTKLVHNTSIPVAGNN